MKYLAMSAMMAGVLAAGAAGAKTPLYAVIDATEVAAADNIESDAQGDLYVTVDSDDVLSVTTIGALPDEGTVLLHGTVSEVDDQDEFTLSDGSGEIDIELKNDSAVAIGDVVSVTGRVDSFLGFKSIEDAEVSLMASEESVQ